MLATDNDAVLMAIVFTPGSLYLSEADTQPSDHSHLQASPLLHVAIWWIYQAKPVIWLYVLVIPIHSQNNHIKHASYHTYDFVLLMYFVTLMGGFLLLLGCMFNSFIITEHYLKTITTFLKSLTRKTLVDSQVECK